MKPNQPSPAQTYVAACRSLEAATMQRLRGTIDDDELDRAAAHLRAALERLVESVKAEARK